MEITAFYIGIYAMLIWMFVSWAFNKVMTRISPKYAAKRQLKQQVKLDRQRDKRLKRKADHDARLLVWAKANPDDPAAKAILAKEASSSSSATAPVDAEPDVLEELRQSQQAADDFERRREARKAAEQLLSQRLLDWALAHPVSPEGRRHLEETLLEANRRVENADSSLTLVGYGAKAEGPEAIETATRIAEIETQKASDVRLIAEIQVALKRSMSDAQ